MTLGFHSPLPPARSGVADYSAAMLRALSPLDEIRVNPAAPCDLEIYHCGNNGLHAAIYRRAIERPGLVVLHDAVLQHLLLGMLGRDEYIAEFAYNYGDWRRDLGARLYDQRAVSGSSAAYFEWPLLRRLAERSLAVATHNPAAARAVRRHLSAARDGVDADKVCEIPHLFEPSPEPGPSMVAELRESWGAGRGTVFGVFGYLRETKRLPAILDAFSRLRSIRPGARLVVAGEFVSAGLERALAPQLAAPGIVRLPHVPEDRFWLHAHAVDVFLNLRYPPAGETSGIGVRMMGIGKPVVFSEGEELARYPPGSHAAIPAGVAEAEALLAMMLLLDGDPRARSAMGRLARNWIRTRHSPAAAALALHTAAKRCLTGIPRQNLQ